MHIILGVLIMGGGILCVIKSEWLLRNFGRVAFFEQHFGLQGGSRLGYKLIGLLLFFIGLLVVVDLFGGLMAWILSPLTKYQS